MISLSVIIPAHNADDTLPDLIKAIESQTVKPDEVIIIDDCSSDKTCEYLSGLSDPLYHIIKNDRNIGAAASRNLGIREAKGKYIVFLDADDIIEPDLFEKVSEAAISDPDIIVWSVSEEYINRDKKTVYVRKHECGCEFAGKLISPGDEYAALIRDLEKATIFGYPWNKAYKKDLLTGKKIEFPPLDFAEDFFFNADAFSAAYGVICLTDTLYHYINRADQGRLTERYVPDYFQIQKDRFKKFLSLQAELMGLIGNDSYLDIDASGLPDEKAAGWREALEIASGRYFRSFSSMIGRELEHGTDRKTIIEKTKDEMKESELYRLLRIHLGDFGMAGRYLYQPLVKGNASAAVNHASLLIKIRRLCPGLFARMKQNR